MARFDEAIARIDAAHAEDPKKDQTGRAQELAYAQRMSAWLDRLEPRASEALKLAVRCQHLRRWAIPRADYPEGKAGYLRWRKDEGAAHAALAGELLAGAGYDTEIVQRVQSLVRKERLKQDPEAQTLEDVTCLVFLDSEFAAFAAKHEEAKLVDILQKTWLKMSERGRNAAASLSLPPHLGRIVKKALEARP